MSSLLAGYIRPGDRILIGEAAAEPPTLVQELIKASNDVPGLTAYCGYTLGPGWDAVQAGTLNVRGFIAHGGLRDLAKRGLLDVLPWHLSSFERLLAERLLPVDVVLLQVGPRDDDGYYNLGATVDYATVAVAHARAVIVEINDAMPRTTSRRRLHTSQVTAAISTDHELVVPPTRTATAAEQAVARNIAALVPDGGRIQLGLGPLADAVVTGLGERRNLRVLSGVVGDWLVDLYESGAMADGPGTTLVSMAVGTRRLYDFLDSNPAVEFGTTRDLLSACERYRDQPLLAVNSALEVDLTGQVNAEVVDRRYVGGIGGQLDFLRAAHRTNGGAAVVALASTDPRGQSRIVQTLAGPVTSPRSDVDLVVTDHGVADLRAASMTERRERLIAIAAPRHRADLAGQHVRSCASRLKSSAPTLHS
jgi:acyl-CoA hydrolase